MTGVRDPIAGHVLGVMSIACVVGAVGPAAAVTMVNTDRTSWESAAGLTVTEGFDGAANGPLSLSNSVGDVMVLLDKTSNDNTVGGAPADPLLAFSIGNPDTTGPGGIAGQTEQIHDHAAPCGHGLGRDLRQ